MGKPVTLEIDPAVGSEVYVFDVFFECRVRNIDIISDADLKDFGSFSTGVPMLDMDNMTQMVSANMSISQLAEHTSKGYPLRFVHAEDVLKVYEYTQNHLNRWVVQLDKMSLNGDSLPIDDLIKLDVFCSEIYEQAKYYDNNKLTNIEKRFGQVVSFQNIKNMFTKVKENEKENKLAEISTKHRKGYADLFNEYLLRKDPSFGSVNSIRLNG